MKGLPLRQTACTTCIRRVARLSLLRTLLASAFLLAVLTLLGFSGFAWNRFGVDPHTALVKRMLKRCSLPRCRHCTDAPSYSSYSSSSSPASATEPCCHDLLAVMLYDLGRFFHEEDIPYNIDYGTLVGGARNGDIVASTSDLDLSVEERYWPQLQYRLDAWAARAAWGPDKAYFFFNDSDIVGRVCPYWGNVWERWRDGGRFYDIYMARSDFAYVDIYSHRYKWGARATPGLYADNRTAAVCVRGVNYPAPCRAAWKLEYSYGPDWRTPDGLGHGKTDYPRSSPRWRALFPAWFAAKQQTSEWKAGECDTQFKCK